MTLTLYSAKGTCALASHIALIEAGADYELRKLDFAAAEQRSPEYLAINPKGRVPALVTDRGVLTETPVILGYIAQTFPDAKLAPNDDSFAFGDMQAFNIWITSSLHPAFAHGFRAARYVDGEEHQAAVKAKSPEQVDGFLQTAEDRLFKGPWVTGEAFTVADPYLYVMTDWLGRIPAVRPVSAFPKIAAHFERMKARPSVAQAREEIGMSPP